MYIEIWIKWTIHKMGCKFKQCYKYIIIQELTLMIKIMYTFHTIVYNTYIEWKYTCKLQYIANINIYISK